MAIVNRDLDVSEQKEWVKFQKKLVSTSGGTFLACVVPFAAEVKAVSASAKGLSGTPSVELEAYKFSGGVTINSSIMAAMVLPAFGTSGAFQSASLGVAGSTQVLVDAGSALVVTMTGANGAADDVVVDVVLRKLQDITSHFGSSS